jgi:hypothetical protein
VVSIRYFLNSCSAKAYLFLKQLVPLPSVSQLYKIFKLVVLFEEQYLTCLDSLHNLAAKWHCREGMSSDSPIKAFFGGDAISQPGGRTPIVDA